MMKDKSILLIISGGIAAYKSLLLIRLLSKNGIRVRTILTDGGAQFVTPLSIGALSGEKVYTDLFSLSDEQDMGHIELSRSADLVVVAPATADIMAKAAHGLAGDLASTTLLATDKKVLFAPAMNVRMWEHAATRANVQTLKDRGALFVGPEAGDMACGEYGEGRMAEPETIAGAIEAALSGPTHIDVPASGALSGRHILITAGPTREPIDPVRYLSNRSSGKQGYAIAEACAALGARVTLVSGPTALSAPKGVRRVDIETARDMLAAVEAALPADVFIGVAAVADWRAASTRNKKIKKDGKTVPPLMLEENPDILKTISNHDKRPPLVIGFAAETNNVLEHARAKLARKNCDWIVANDVSGDVMGGDENTMILLSAAGTDSWPKMSKQAAARKLAEKIAQSITKEEA